MTFYDFTQNGHTFKKAKPFFTPVDFSMHPFQNSLRNHLNVNYFFFTHLNQTKFHGQASLAK